jgi:hypothetical protein
VWADGSEAAMVCCAARQETATVRLRKSDITAQSHSRTGIIVRSEIETTAQMVSLLVL